MSEASLHRRKKLVATRPCLWGLQPTNSTGAQSLIGHDDQMTGNSQKFTKKHYGLGGSQGEKKEGWPNNGEEAVKKWSEKVALKGGMKEKGKKKVKVKGTRGAVRILP